MVKIPRPYMTAAMVSLVAISGAGGFLARNLRRHLAGEGIRVLCISRGEIECRGNETMLASPEYSEGEILPHMRTCTAFVHLAWAHGGSSPDSANLDLARRLLDMCRKAGVGRFIYTSGLGVASSPPTGYFRTKRMVEEMVASSGLDYTIFRPSYILGYDDYLTLKLKKQAAKGSILLPGSGGHLIHPIHIDDACRIIRMSLDSTRFLNRTLDLVGPQIVTYGELVSRMGTATETVDLAEARRRAAGDPGYGLSLDDLAILCGSYTGDHATLQKLSGVRFTPYVEALKASGLS